MKQAMQADAEYWLKRPMDDSALKYARQVLLLLHHPPPPHFLPLSSSFPLLRLFHSSLLLGCNFLMYSAKV